MQLATIAGRKLTDVLGLPGILELTEKDDLQCSRWPGIGLAADLRPIRLRFPDRNLAGYAIACVCKCCTDDR